jgi:plastocyanin
VKHLAGVAGSVVGIVVLAFFSAVPATAAQSSVKITAGCSGTLYCFTPSSITIHDGDTVVWTNTSHVGHTVTRCDAGACNGTGAGTGTDASFTSGNISGGGTLSHTFHGTGTYNYYCQIHGFLVMHGTITVLSASPPPTTSAPTPTTAATGTPATTAAPAAGTPASNVSPSTGSGASPTTVTADAPAELAHTGAPSFAWAGAALFLVALGIALVASQRRRATR